MLQKQVISQAKANYSLCCLRLLVLLLFSVEHFGVLADEVFLVHDDLELPLGKCMIKMGGSAKFAFLCNHSVSNSVSYLWIHLSFNRGHNGVRSTMAHLQSDVSHYCENIRY